MRPNTRPAVPTPDAGSDRHQHLLDPERHEEHLRGGFLHLGRLPVAHAHAESDLIRIPVYSS